MSVVLSAVEEEVASDEFGGEAIDDEAGGEA